MADDQEQQNDGGEENGVADYAGEETTTIDSTTIPVDGKNPLDEDYGEEENIPDFTVKLIINDAPDLVDAAVTDMYGNIIPGAKNPLIDSVNGYTQAISQGIYDEINGTDAAGKKHWMGTWGSKKILYVVLIALCVIAIILAILFLVLGKKFKKNKRSSPVGGTTVTKSVVTTGVQPNPQYKQVAQGV